MWREAPMITGDKYYRFQTIDPKINRKMVKRKDFDLTLYGLNTSLWVHRTTKYSLKDAKKTLMRITGNQNINFDPVNEVYCTKSGVTKTQTQSTIAA